MLLLRLGQLYKATDLSEKQKVELVNNIDTAYTIPDNTFRNLQEKSGYNCLHIATLKLDFVCIYELLKRGADVLVQGKKDGKPPVHVAINVKSNCKGKQLWEISGKLQDCQVVNALLFAHVNSNNSFSPKCKDGITHLHIACMFNCLEAVRFFLKNGEAIDQVTNADAAWPSYTPLHFAMRYSSVETTEILLTEGADLFARNDGGTSPLHILMNRMLDLADYINMGQYTSSYPYKEELQRLEKIASIVVKMKSENGISVLDDSGLTIFHVACIIRDSLIAASFLNDILNLNEAVKIDADFWPGWTPLHFAAWSNTEIVKLLMQRGADITIKNKEGKTPLELCFKRYSPKIVHSILSIQEEFKNILFSDNSTSLLDFILAMNHCKSLSEFVETLEQCNISVCSTSPLLPGCGILHLILLANAKTKSWNDFFAETDLLETIDSLPKTFYRTEDETCYFWSRIIICKRLGCSVDLKNDNGLMLFHSALDMKSYVLAALLEHSKENVTDPHGLSHLHVACAVKNQKAVKVYLDAGANINAVAAKSFQRYEYFHLPPDTEIYRLISVNANSTPLHVAVTFEHTNIVENLLDRGADIYATDSQGFTPIHLSMCQPSGSNEIAKMLINRSPELIEMLTKEGLSHLHVAAFAGDMNAIARLVRNGADVNLPVPDFLSRFAGKTPIQIVTQYSGNNVVATLVALMDAGADIYANDTLQCLMGEDDVDFSEYLVAQLKLNESVNGPIDSSGLTLLHVACSKFDVDWAKDLLSSGANVNARIRDDEDYRGRWKGYTPLHVVVSRKYSNNDVRFTLPDRLSELLLNRGADATIDSQDGTPLHLAYRGYTSKQRAEKTASERRCRLIELPWSLHLDFARQRLFDGLQQTGEHQMPLYVRAQQTDLQQRVGWQRHEVPVNPPVDEPEQTWKDTLAELILGSQMNFRVNPIDPEGFSHFHFFCMTDKLDAVKEFLNNGVDINHSTNPFSKDVFAGYTALHFAIKYHAFRVVDFLLEHGADVNMEGTDGNTPLHLMVMQASSINSRRAEILSLNRHGAKFNVRNQRGESPADVLMTKHFTLKQLQFLLSEGSSINPNKNKSIPGPIALIMQNGLTREVTQLLKLFINVCDIPAAVKSGYSPIQDTVKAKNYRFFTTDDFFNIIVDVLNSGCDVDRLDEKGFTALRTAIGLGNNLAVYALLQIGANLNACDIDSEFFSEEGSPEIEVLIAYQVHKMHELGLDVSDAANSIYREFRQRITMKGVLSDMAFHINLELERARSIKFTMGISARAFLSELWGTAHYSRLSLTDRQNVDAYFKNIKSVRIEFPYLCGIMLCQYNKALVRPKLMKDTVEVLGSECEIYLPRLPLECIVSFISNDHLKHLIKHSKKAENFSQEI